MHDFYAICPRVTLINAVDSYCGVAALDVCNRCIAIGGAHEASKLNMLTATEHRALFSRLLSGMHAVIAPSEDAARHVERAFPHVAVRAIPHPEYVGPIITADRPRDRYAVALLGGIGPHKGANKLLELARLAELSHPELHFYVIGHTSLDDALENLSNVTVTGKYRPEELPVLVTASRSAIALFLHVWPETYSYTLSEAVSAGLLPIVPDIGAPAERVRATGWGRVFPFLCPAHELLDLLVETCDSVSSSAPPFSRYDTSSSICDLREMFTPPITPAQSDLSGDASTVRLNYVRVPQDELS